jgi:hypothetical protein
VLGVIATHGLNLSPDGFWCGMNSEDGEICLCLDVGGCDIVVTFNGSPGGDFSGTEYVVR